jgi:hypothetical protein
MEMLAAIEEGGDAFLLFTLMIIGIFITMLLTITR